MDSNILVAVLTVMGTGGKRAGGSGGNLCFCGYLNELSQYIVYFLGTCKRTQHVEPRAAEQTAKFHIFINFDIILEIPLGIYGGLFLDSINLIFACVCSPSVTTRKEKLIGTRNTCIHTTAAQFTLLACTWRYNFHN